MTNMLFCPHIYKARPFCERTEQSVPAMPRMKQHTPVKHTAEKPSAAGKVDDNPHRKRRRTGWKQRARGEMARIQRSARTHVPRAAIARAVKEVFSDSATTGVSVNRIQRKALDGLHHACEAFATDLFQRADKYAGHAGRITLHKKDIQAAVGDMQNIDASEVRSVVRTLEARPAA